MTTPTSSLLKLSNLWWSGRIFTQNIKSQDTHRQPECANREIEMEDSAGRPVRGYTLLNI